MMMTTMVMISCRTESCRTHGVPTQKAWRVMAHGFGLPMLRWSRLLPLSFVVAGSVAIKIHRMTCVLVDSVQSFLFPIWNGVYWFMRMYQHHPTSISWNWNQHPSKFKTRTTSFQVGSARGLFIANPLKYPFKQLFTSLEGPLVGSSGCPTAWFSFEWEPHPMVPMVVGWGASMAPNSSIRSFIMNGFQANWLEASWLISSFTSWASLGWITRGKVPVPSWAMLTQLGFSTSSIQQSNCYVTWCLTLIQYLLLVLDECLFGDPTNHHEPPWPSPPCWPTLNNDVSKLWLIRCCPRPKVPRNSHCGWECHASTPRFMTADLPSWSWTGAVINRKTNHNNKGSDREPFIQKIFVFHHCW